MSLSTANCAASAAAVPFITGTAVGPPLTRSHTQPPTATS